MLTAEKHRYQPALPPVRAAVAAHIAWLEQALKELGAELDAELDHRLRASPLWRERDFWGQFYADGTIHPGLPTDSPWHSVGNPVVLSTPFDAAHPRVASFPNWTIPTLVPGDNGHYCMAVPRIR